VAHSSFSPHAAHVSAVEAAQVTVAAEAQILLNAQPGEQ